MKAEATSVGASIDHALVRETCPVCGILKDFQWTLVEQLRQGIHDGGGFLERAAEFLVGQRGL